MAANRRFQQRMDEMRGKSGFNDVDYFMIHQAVAAHEAVINSYCTALPRKLESASEQCVIRHFLEEGQRAESALKQLWLRPFTTLARLLQQNYQDLGRSVDSHNRTAAREAIVKIHVVKKLFKVLQTFEQLKDRILSPADIRIEDLKGFVQAVRSEFESWQVFPEHTVPAYEPPYRSLLRALGQIESRLEHYRNQDLSYAGKRAMFKRMKKFLDRFDIEAMLSALIQK